MKNGFFHVKIDELSQKYTTFIVPDEHLEFTKVPFGLCNSPAVFQRFVNVAFNIQISQGIVLAYMDDLIIPSANFEEGLARLNQVLNRASEVGLSMNWKKCSFLQGSSFWDISLKVDAWSHLLERPKLYKDFQNRRMCDKFNHF